LVKALRSLCETFTTLPQPASTQGLGEKLSELKRLAEVAGNLGLRLRNVPRYELDRLVRLATAVERMSRRASIRHHIHRIDDAIETVAGHFPNQVSGQIQAWRTARRGLESQGFLGTDTDYAGAAVEAFLDRVTDGDVPSTEVRAQVLSWTLNAPASALQTVSRSLEIAETTVIQLLEYVEEYFKGASDGGGTTDDIHAAGARIEAASDKAMKGLEDTPND
jgi:hypothetical protein